MYMQTLTSTIAAAGTNGSAVNLAALSENRLALAAISLPAAYNKTTVTFNASFDGGTTWLPVIKTDGTVLTYTFTASTAQAVAVPPVDLCGFPMIRPVAPSGVGAESVIGFHFRIV